MNLADLDIAHHFVGGELYFKRTKINAGMKLTQHIHPYDHASALVSGTVVLEVDGSHKTLTGPAWVLVQAGKAHSVTALTDAVWHCGHITNDTDPETVDHTILTA
jgi:quercetin dioxygenase-like cupin family protein